MATTSRTATSRASTKTPAKKKAETNISEEPKEQVKEEKIIPKAIDPHEYIVVKNGTYGRLVYKSKRTGEKFTWDTFGDEQEMELQELKNAKGSSKRFFENNWFMFDEDNEWVIDYLGLRQFYKNALTLKSFDELFTKSPAEMTKIINGLSDGQKHSLSYRARQLIEDGTIDSNKSITALEKALGVELVER